METRHACPMETRHACPIPAARAKIYPSRHRYPWRLACCSPLDCTRRTVPCVNSEPSTRQSIRARVRKSSLNGFHECFMHIKYNATSAKFHFFIKYNATSATLWAQFHMRWKPCETPIETQIEFHHATMQLNHTMREVVEPLSL
jgi:hypothetical protein